MHAPRPPAGKPTSAGGVFSKDFDPRRGHILIDHQSPPLEVVEVGIDDDGEPISSCIIVEADDETRAGKARKKKLSPKEQIALRILQNCLATSNEMTPIGAG